jgi:hypothetical protein
MDRIKQNVVPDPNDPALKAQTDAFNANQDRATTHYLQQLAEQGGANANIAAETRSAKESAGQAEGTFGAQTTLNEITARRAEVQQAIQSAVSMGEADKALALQDKLAQLDNAFKYYSARQQDTQFNKQLDQSESQFRDSLTENDKQFYDNLSEQDKQFYDGLSENEKQFFAQLAQRAYEFDQNYNKDLLLGA